MRILQINNMNQVAQIYGNDLASRGHSVTLYEPSFVGGLAPLPIKLALMPWRLLAMRHIIGKLSPKYFDILHIHWASYGVLGLVGNVPFVVHCRGDDVRDRLQHPIFRPLLLPILQQAAAVICVTPDLLPTVQAVRSDAFFFPVPIDTGRFTPEPHPAPADARPWTMLLFARLDLNKGVHIATQALASFLQRHRDIRVQLLDWGDLKEQYRQQYSDRFEFIPRCAPDKVEHLIRGADVIVGQFALGALGVSELQAMSCAKPVICSHRYAEAYADAVPIRHADTAEEIDAHLEELFQHPEIGAALGQKARAWVMRYHDHMMLSITLEKLYQAIIRSAGSRE